MNSNKSTLLRSIIYLICLVLIKYSCSPKHEQATGELIRIDPNLAVEEINLSEFIDTIIYIKLQTETNDILGRVLTIDIKDKYIYASDWAQHRIYVFDKDGKFISKLDKRGKGPGEYPFLSCHVIDDNEEYIELLPLFKDRFLKYRNLSFDLIEEYSMFNITHNSVRKVDDTYYFATQQMDNWYDNEKTNADLFIARNGKIVKTLFNKTIYTGGSIYCPNVESFTRNNLGELFVSLMYNNTFYQLRDLDAHPIFTVDFGKYGIDNSIGLKSLEKQIEYLESSTALASFPVLNINNANVLAFSYYFKRNNTKLPHLEDLHFYIEFKNSDKIFHTRRIKNDITDFPNEVLICTYNYIGHEVWYKDYLVDIVEPARYLSQNNKSRKYVKGLGEITTNDNPIIILMKFKDDLK
jgi:hypothetical protein